MAKAKAKAKGKDAPKRRKGDAPAGVATLSSHPRAVRDLLRARGWGALIGFALVAWMSHGAGAPMADVLLRAIIGGTIGGLVGWTAAVVAWRSVAGAEIRAAGRAAEEAHRVHAEARRAKASA